MRLWPALSAGLMLAACANDDSGQRSAEPPSTSSGAMIPGEIEDGDYGNVGNTTYFGYDSAVLVPEAERYLQKQAAWIQAYPQYGITIEGHADERGTREYNLALGERRADAVMAYLIALGVDPKRLKTISYGKERPLCAEANEACWSQNRRGVTTLDQ
jgi:peptidoglycan-associated lipoprotein